MDNDIVCTLISWAVHKRLWVAKVNAGWTMQLKHHIDRFSDGRIAVRRSLEDDRILMMNVEIAEVGICLPHHLAIWRLLKEPNLYVVCRCAHTNRQLFYNRC